MKNPTTIIKTSTKEEHSRFYKVSYNGKELGEIGVFNIFTGAGVQGLRMVWHEKGKPFRTKKGRDGIFFEMVDKDAQGNIRHTK